MLLKGLFSIAAWGATLVITAVFGLCALATCWVPPRGCLYLIWARLWARSVLVITGVSYRIERTPAGSSVQQAVFMANHESHLDTLPLLLAIGQQVRFLAKRSLFWIPLLGWSMWAAGFVPVDRHRPGRARGVLTALEARIAEGLSVLVFPEGTRSRSGELGEFKKSGFLLALKTGLPIVPIGISGSRAVLGADRFLFRPGVVTVRVGEPIPTEGLGVSQRTALMDQVRREILRLTGRL